MELKLRCQPTSEKKHALAGHLKSAISKKLPQYSSLEEAKQKAKPQKKKRIVNGLKLFPDTAFWRELYPDSIAVQEPANPTLCIGWALTISEQDAGHVPKKYNFTEKFDISPFIGMKKELMFDRRGELKRTILLGKHLQKIHYGETRVVLILNSNASISYLLPPSPGKLQMPSFLSN